MVLKSTWNIAHSQFYFHTLQYFSGGTWLNPLGFDWTALYDRWLEGGGWCRQPTRKVLDWHPKLYYQNKLIITRTDESRTIRAGTGRFWFHVYFVKGIVHPKLKILSFTHPQVVTVWISLFCWTQRKIFWRKFVTRHHWLHSRKKKILWKSMVPQNCSVSHILQNIFLCVQQNKDIHTGLKLLEGE